MGSRILIVDDDEELTKVMAVALRASGHETRTFGDGLAAMAGIEEFRPEVIITDLMMPGLPGAALIAQVRAMKELDDVKIIVYSAKTFEYDYRASLEAGA